LRDFIRRFFIGEGWFVFWHLVGRVMRKGYEPRHFVIQNTLVFQVTADPLFHPFKGGHRLAQCQTPKQFAIKPGGGPGLP